MKEKRNLLIGSVLIAAFALWTFLIQCVDVQAVGQNGTKIGFADFNVLLLSSYPHAYRKGTLRTADQQE